jgi:ATP-binding cassette subfamily B protein
VASQASDSRSFLFSQYRRAFAYIAPYWRRLILVIVVSLASTLLGLSQPYISKLLIDEALLRRNSQMLLEVAALMVGVTVLSFALNILASYRYVKTSAEVLFDMRLAVYRHLQRLSPRFYARRPMGDIVSRINNDIGEVQRISADSVLGLLANVVFLVGSVAIMLWLNARLFLVSVALVPLSVASLRHFQRRLTGQVRDLRERSADIGSFLIETLLGMRLVVSSGAEDHEVERFRKRNVRFIDALLSMQLTSYLAGAAPGAILVLSTAILFLYGGHLVIQQQLTVGGLVAFLAYHLRLLAPVQNLMGLYTNLVTGAVSLDRVFELLDTPVEVVERPGAVVLPEVRGEVALEGVTLRHDREAAVLDCVTFHIPAGSVCAVVGPSGVGKSTIADLILRLYDPDEGTVYLDGHDLREVRLADVRKAVALVEQTPYLFNASVRENICYARPEATEQEIIEAARAAAIHDFIHGLPQGYDTMVGERGLALSAGERQRVAIARALLRRPRVLVLDEPTAALDPVTEKSLAGTLAGVLRGRTAVIITHRLSLVELADQVVLLEDGRVTESGSPAELLARGGALARHFAESLRDRKALTAAGESA